jgi:uncharacterized protein (UPF0276 family)
VIDPVWALLRSAYDTLGVFPTLLERDENIPDLPVVLGEVEAIAQMPADAAARALRRRA